MNRTALAAAALVALLGTISAHAAFQAHVLFCDPARGMNIYVFDVATSTYKTVYDGNDASIQAPRLSPDGKKIAFYMDGALWLMNNDGSGLEEIAPITSEGRKGLRLQYTTKGIFYMDLKANVFHIDLDNKTNTKIYTVPGIKANDGWAIWMSRNAERAVAWAHGAATGDRDPIVELSSDLKTITHEWVDIWGHGWFITPDGEHITINAWSGSRGVCGPQHKRAVMYRFSDQADHRMTIPAP